jgi:hypothetical protein
MADQRAAATLIANVAPARTIPEWTHVPGL